MKESCAGQGSEPWRGVRTAAAIGPAAAVQVDSEYLLRPSRHALCLPMFTSCKQSRTLDSAYITPASALRITFQNSEPGFLKHIAKLTMVDPASRASWVVPRPSRTSGQKLRSEPIPAKSTGFYI